MQKTILKNIQTMIRVLVNRRRKINMAIFDRIFKAIQRLEFFPLSCPLIDDEMLRQQRCLNN
mgnify:CR=1 FL=1